MCLTPFPLERNECFEISMKNMLETSTNQFKKIEQSHDCTVIDDTPMA